MIESLSKAVDAIAEEIAALRELLKPVSSPVPPQPVGVDSNVQNDAKIRQAGSPLTEQLVMHLEQLESLRRQVLTIRQELDIPQ